MKFVTINDKLAPIRVLRQVDCITDDELGEFLAAERDFKLEQLSSGALWVEVVDMRRFAGLTAEQRKLCGAWVEKNIGMTAKTTIGIALTVPPGLEERAELFTMYFDRLAIPSMVTSDIEKALYWAIERSYDEDVVVDPDLVIGGIDAFRRTID
ncbi:hypothetical protein ENSA5_24920 [Enhygromyxa salina]|uniref:Uncharacterized protein n=1 Tax=Enhygromyxa salina TaxID=215803 RepID=A0A2S9YB74_9BACT|nr:hypothetical protein [Enhygromyxa salina]PRQ02256.1 hypothetical protein ENSA5_24920 [Enhygromyxa salina]